MDNDQLYFLWLASKFPAGSDVFSRLLEKFECVEEIFLSNKYEIQSKGFKGDILYPLLDKSLDRAKRVQEVCYRKSIGILCCTDPSYPSYLYDIPNPPIVLFFRGYIPNFDDNVAIGMVGTRDMSDTGKFVAHRFAFNVAATGAIVVSGLAVGIDAMCHVGALDGGGETIAILGSGVDEIYPRENSILYDRVREHGAVISEYFPGTPPNRDNFPIRNRLIAGFSRAVIVVEAPVGSGALITANFASLQGKPVFAIPGTPLNPMCTGSNALLQENARPALDVYDILADYEMTFPHRISTRRAMDKKYYMSGYEKPMQSSKKVLTLNTKRNVRPPDGLYGTERIAYETILSDGLVVADTLVEKGIELNTALRSFVELEIRGYVDALPGGFYSARLIQENNE